MLAAEDHIPLVVPLGFLGFGIALVIVHRLKYDDLESFIRATARARANSFFGDGDVERALVELPGRDRLLRRDHVDADHRAHTTVNADPLRLADRRMHSH